ncbi:GGDEF domain-containing protein [Fibrobacter sp. UWH1]|uniref:GGDEF domain-containing protein n=1 Tax=Fibrobacter sp. UWH1 TaxID=1964354 RepID=UPI000B521F99|nr:GGDEF domain-containing protein [Fibrobacter sp. UWH1]OWV08819.1 GGDEF domain-containing protein [Fibrobacter sp. UWH1]
MTMVSYIVWLIAFVAGVGVSFFVPEATISLGGKFAFIGAWGAVLGFVLYTLCKRRVETAEAEFNENLESLKASQLDLVTGIQANKPAEPVEKPAVKAPEPPPVTAKNEIPLPKGAISAREALEKIAGAPLRANFPLDVWKRYAKSILKDRPFGEVLANLEKLLPAMFPKASGILYMYAGTQTDLRKLYSFGPSVISDASIRPGECASYNSGEIVVCDYSKHDLSGGCTHLHHRPQGISFCAPIEGLEEHFGIFSLQVDALPDNESLDDWHAKVSFVATTFGLYVSNQNLNVRYKEHSIRDNLTGLFNRRYMEESLAREIAAATRHKTPIGLIMLYPDSIAEIQKTKGRHAVEQLLWELGQRLPGYIRTEDIPCRYDGEMFCIILPGADLKITRQRAEKIRHEISQLQIAYGAGVLATPLSLGVAVMPAHAADGGSLLYMAEASLRHAMQAGGNRVTIADALINR